MGEWWRADGAERLVARGSAAQEPPRAGLEEGFGLLQSEADRLLGSGPEHAARGPLTFDPDDGMYVALWGVSEAVFEAEPKQFTIHGRTNKGRPCSLIDCFAVNTTRHLFGGFSERRILSHALVHGIHVEDLDSFQFTKAQVQVPGLRDFMSVGRGLEETESLDVALDGGRVEFIPAYAIRRPSPHIEVKTERAIARFELDEPLDYPTWMERLINPLVRLIMFSTGEPTRVESFAAIFDVESSKEPTPVPSPKTVNVEVVAQPLDLSREPKFRRDRMLLSVAALGDDFDGVVARWWGVHAKLGGAADFLFGALSTKLPLEVQLITLASVAEAYHRIVFPDETAIEPDRHEELRGRMVEGLEDPKERDHYFRRLGFDYELSQEERLLKLLKRAGNIVPALSKRPGRLASAISATRNYVAHLPVERRDEVLEGAEMYNATQLLLLVIHCNLLLDLDIPTERAEALVSGRFGQQPYFKELVKRGSSRPKVG